MLENNCTSLLFSSSATVYDMSDPDKREYSETDRTGNTANPYGTTKLVMEQIIRDLCLTK
jgi:UDP-glucose 4-epimerase